MSAVSLVTKGMICGHKKGTVIMGGGGGGIVYRDKPAKKLSKEELLKACENMFPKVTAELITTIEETKEIKINTKLFEAIG